MTLAGWLLLAIGAVAGLIALLLVVGSRLPRARAVCRALTVSQPPDVVWQLITDYANCPRWHPGVLSAERLPDEGGRTVWRETRRGGRLLQLRTVEVKAPFRLVRAAADEYGRSYRRWEFDLETTDGGCRVTLTERAEIPNPLFRFLARVFLGPAADLETYLRALAAELGEPAAVENCPLPPVS